MQNTPAPELCALAEQIAEALGKPWTTSPPVRFHGASIHAYESLQHQYLQGEGDERLELWFTRDSKMQRLTVDGRYPSTARGGYIGIPHGMERPDITVAISRGTAVIAKEIARRLLPEYRKVLLAIREIKQRTDACENSQEANLKSFAEVFGAVPSADNLKNASMHVRVPLSDLRIEVEAFDSAVNLKLRSVPMDKALMLAQLLAKTASPVQSSGSQ